MNTLKIDHQHWVTPYTDVEDQQVGRARLRKTKYRKGAYPLYGIQGNDQYQLLDSIWVTRLQVQDVGGQWDTWMQDDPLHWLTIKKYTDQLKKGSVLCAGLGLGLMLFRLLQRKDITEIHVVEKENDVIQLIKPLLPADTRIGITNDDYYEYLSKRQHFDNIFWDLAVGTLDSVKAQIDDGTKLTQRLAPDSHQVYFGSEESRLVLSSERIRV